MGLVHTAGSTYEESNQHMDSQVRARTKDGRTYQHKASIREEKCYCADGSLRHAGRGAAFLQLDFWAAQPAETLLMYILDLGLKPAARHDRMLPFFPLIFFFFFFLDANGTATKQRIGKK